MQRRLHTGGVNRNEEARSARACPNVSSPFRVVRRPVSAFDSFNFVGAEDQEALVERPIGSIYRHDRQFLLWVDAVDKVGDEQRAGNNRIQVPRFLNQCCAPDSYLESMLLTRPSKNVFRQHRSEADKGADLA
jgi:hypothetical protein